MAPSRLPNTCLAEKFTGCNNALTCGFTCHQLAKNLGGFRTFFGIKTASELGLCKIKDGGGVGIRTLDALLGHTHLAGEHLRPLGHSSAPLSSCQSYPSNDNGVKRIVE